MIRPRRVLAGILLLVAAAAVARGQQTFQPEPPSAAPNLAEQTFGVDVSLMTPLAAASAPQTWGDTAESLYVVDSSELYPLAPGDHYGVFNGTLRYSSSFAGLPFIAPLHLPSGAQIDSLEMDFYDASPTGRALGLLVVCDYRGQTCNFIAGEPGCEFTICSDAAGADGYGTQFAILSGSGTVDNFASRYYLAAGNDVTDGTVAISQFVVGYFLQVSPAPDTATFTDVPTSHPFFQYIEALAASGITGGCGGGNYCPNAPLTRGQMAVFLSKALGLEFP